jgi:chromosome segregation ATPase
LLPELNQYKQNNIALQQQIESLMTKLNESKKSERELRNILGMTEMKCAEFEDKAAHADKLAKSVQALQNTIDHLESRLEIANIERIDAEEQVSNLRSDKSPFDLATPRNHVPPSANRAAFGARMSTSTVFSGASPISPELECQENATIVAFVAHVERLQDRIREKDVSIANLENERKQLRQIHSRFERDHNKTPIHSDFQEGLLQETLQIDTHMEQLRTAVLDRESVIEEKEKEIRSVERQLEHHKLLLQAEIRRNAAIKLHEATNEEDLWPELTSLARREDIERWMNRLHERLRREQPKMKGKALVDTPDLQMESLRKEIDFYVREIILFKLDIRGYKSDIRKLKKITAQMEAYGRTSDLDFEACSLRQTATPVHQQFTQPTPELSITASPVIDDNHTRTTRDEPRECPVTPSPPAPSHNLDYITIVPRNSRELNIPATLHEMAHRDECALEADRMGCEVSSHTAVPQSDECRKATICTLLGS